MPETFGRYELRQLLGRGGMGEVYRAFDTVRGREVALKVLPAHLASDESFQTRFRRESQLAARLNDPHIIPIHDFGEIDGRLFLDMRLVEGEDLSSVLERRGRLPIATAVGIIAQVASALDAAHESGLVHRDVKPSNILLSGMPGPGRDTGEPFAYLVDFGIARNDAQDATRLTATTTTLGTVAYLAPERIGGSPGDRRVDVYALACVLHECIGGRTPFDGEMLAILFGHVNTEPPRLRATVPDCPPALEDVVRRGLAKDPDQRYASAGGFARAAQDALRLASTAPVPGDEPTLRARAIPAARPPAPAGAPGYPGRPGAAALRPPAPPWTPPPSGQDEELPSGRRPPGSRRRGLLAVLAAVVVAAAGIGTAVALRGGGSGSSADPTRSGGTTGSPTPDFPSGSGDTPAQPLRIATGSQTAWSDFASFSGLVGTSDGDSSHAFRNASCTLREAGQDASVGIVDKVDCTFQDSPTVLLVARFSSARNAQRYLNRLQDASGYTALPWAQDDRARGVRYTSPADAGTLDITTTVCAMPTYLVQFSATDTGAVPPATLREQFWGRATFPDVVPPACAPDLRSATGATAAGISPTKPGVDFTDDSLRAFLRRGSTAVGVTTAPVGSGSESIAFTQTGTVTFWGTRPGEGVTRLGASTYPVDADLGAPGVTVPEGQVLTGMEHAMFVLRGRFTMDGSGNAVAYTDGAQGWGAIKAKSNGNLAPSGQGIGADRIGLGQDFGYSKGRLETVDCSSELPISRCGGNDRVFKYWRWTGTEFVLAGRAGLRR